jgi:hypothetical protein
MTLKAVGPIQDPHDHDKDSIFMQNRFLLFILIILSAVSALTVVPFADAAVIPFADAPVVGGTSEAPSPSMFSQFISGFSATQQAAYQEERPSQLLYLQIMTYINFLLTLIGVVFFALLLHAGWIWLMARGNESEVEKAKKMVREITIGILTILIARIFTQFVVTQLYNSLIV